jgi:potassium-transporting ATPase KdpC subunit
MSMDLVQFLVYLVFLLLVASGLDPHITPEAAAVQIPRVARVCGINGKGREHIVTDHTEDCRWGIFGQPGVNVLLLNLALDGINL